jgi:hypothetical protein
MAVVGLECHAAGAQVDDAALDLAGVGLNRGQGAECGSLENSLVSHQQKLLGGIIPGDASGNRQFWPLLASSGDAGVERAGGCRGAWGNQAPPAAGTGLALRLGKRYLLVDLDFPDATTPLVETGVTYDINWRTSRSRLTTATPSST